MDRHKVTDYEDRHFSYHASKEGVSTPSVLDNNKHDSQRAIAGTSSNTMEDCIPFPNMYSRQSSLANECNNATSSAVSEPPQKKQRRTGVQFDEGNLVGRLPGEVPTIANPAELGWLLQCEPPIPNSPTTFVEAEWTSFFDGESPIPGSSTISGGGGFPWLLECELPIPNHSSMISGGGEFPWLLECETPNPNHSSTIYEGNLVGRLTGEVPTIANPAELGWLVGCEPPIPNDSFAIEGGFTSMLECASPIPNFASVTQGALPPNDPEFEVCVDPMYTSNFMPHKSLLPDRYLATSVVGSASCGRIQVTAPPRSTNEAQTNVYPLVGEEASLPRIRLVIVKQLSKSDTGKKFSGIKLPKKPIETCLPGIPNGLEGLPVTIRDGVESDRIWNMSCVVWHKPSKRVKTMDQIIYVLKGSFEYLRHHSLQEGDWVRIFQDEPSSEYIMTFDKNFTVCIPPSYQNLLGKTWKLVIRKMLQTHDCRARGHRAKGEIALKRRKVLEHLLPVEDIDQAGFEIKFHDWKFDGRTWVMRIKFGPHASGTKMYRLVDTAEFLRRHDLQEDDWLDVLKSNGPGDGQDASYAIRAWKRDDVGLR